MSFAPVHGSSRSFSGLWRNALFGAVGGFLSWLVTEHFVQDRATAGPASSAVWAMAVFFLFIGGIIGTALGSVEGVLSLSRAKALRGAAVGLVLGMVGGAFGGALGQLLFSFIGGRIRPEFGQIPPILVLARTTGWALLGAVIGLAQGAAFRSAKRLLQGLVGGLIGGAIGGLCFDAVGRAFQGGEASRMIALTLLGLFIALAIAAVEELAKQAWLTIAIGRPEGKQFILTKPETLLGSAEVADVPLFGDPTILPRHASITKTPQGYRLSPLPGAQVGVGGAPSAAGVLQDGDLIDLGKFRLLYRERAKGAAQPSAAPRPVVAPSPVAPPPAPPPPPAWRHPGWGRLVPLAGGAAYDLIKETVTLGREPSNDVQLADDSVSRQHAMLTWSAGRCFIEDRQSTNGTFVAGARVVGRIAVPSGAKVTFGGVAFHLECRED